MPAVSCAVAAQARAHRSEGAINMRPGAGFPRRPAQTLEVIEGPGIDIARLQDQQRIGIQRRQRFHIETPLIISRNALDLRRADAGDGQRFAHAGVRSVAHYNADRRSAEQSSLH